MLFFSFKTNTFKGKKIIQNKLYVICHINYMSLHNNNWHENLDYITSLKQFRKLLKQIDRDIKKNLWKTKLIKIL